MRSVLLWLVGLLVLAGTLAPTPAAAKAPARRPAPSWVKDVALDASLAHANEKGRDSFTLLSDTRIRLGTRGVERYRRFVAQALTAAGVEKLAEVLVDFDPAYETLVLHHILLRRGDTVLDESTSATVRMVAQESELERRVYNGTLSAYIVLTDVRPGDIVDLSYSLLGANPVLGEHYVTSFPLATREPIRQLHIEITDDSAEAASAEAAPTPKGNRKGTPTVRAGAHLIFRARATSGEASAPHFEPSTPTPGTWVWDLHDVAARAEDDAVPNGLGAPELEASDFSSWGEVARWGAALYPLEKAPAGIAEQANAVTLGATTPEDVALRLTRFVQDDIRYLAIATGEHGLRPHPVEDALAQRLGDCKDKTYLLLHLLHEKGISATPVLVNSDEKARVADHMPTPFAFDHVILRVEIGGKRYFVDPTYSFQGGDLQTQVAPDFALGLPLSAATESLEPIPMPEASEPERSTVAEIAVANDGSADIQVTTSLLREAADGLRHHMAETSLETIGEHYANYYQRHFPDLSLAAPLAVTDDRAANRVRSIEHYHVEHFWREGERSLYPDSVDGFLRAPHVVRRSLPLAVAHPTWVRERFQVTLPFKSEIEWSSQTSVDAAMKYSRVISNTDNTVSATHEYKSLADAVPVSAISEHLSALQRARDISSLTLSDEAEDAHETEGAAGRRTGKAPEAQRLRWTLGLFAGLLAFAFLPAIGGLRWVRRRRQFQKRGQPRPGDTAALAMAVKTRGDANIEMAKQRCDCGAQVGGTAVAWSEVRLGAGSVQVARVACPACASPVHRYFSITE